MIRSREIVEIDIYPLDVDFINENVSLAKNVPTPRIASIHKSRFSLVVMQFWMEAIYIYVNGKMLHQLHTRDVFY